MIKAMMILKSGGYKKKMNNSGITNHVHHLQIVLYWGPTDNNAMRTWYFQ